MPPTPSSSGLSTTCRMRRCRPQSDNSANCSSPSSHNSVRLRFFSLPELPRSEAGRSHISQHYEDISELWTSHLDGLIVTGTEPRAPALADEPYWPTLTKLVDWADDHAISTIWSCLAAHAAVLHLDGIRRRAFREKLSGVFDCTKAADHAIVDGAPSRWRVPHSRYNELPEDALASSGYRILSRLPGTGADMFVKQRKTLFLFVQGHLEYDPGALLREYRRDVRRFLAGERDSYPEMPCGYFDEDAAAALAAFRRQALGNRSVDLLLRISRCHSRREDWRTLGLAGGAYIRELVIIPGRAEVPKPRLDEVTTFARVHSD